MRLPDQYRDLIEKEQCPFCGREHVIKESPRTGEYYCSNCGYVSDFPYIDETSEYRQFAMEHGVKDKSRSSNAGDEMVDELATGIEYDGSPQAKRMARLNQRIQADPSITKLKIHVRNIRNLCGNLQLSRSISDRACKLFKEALDLGHTKNKKGEALNAACVYYACEDKGSPKNMSEILRFTDNLTKREMEKEMNTIKLLPSLENLEQKFEESMKRFCPSLGLGQDIQQACYDVAAYLREAGIGEGKKPQTRIAAVIAYVSNKSADPKDHRKLEEISLKVGPKKDTIQQRMNEIEPASVKLTKIPSFQAILNKKA
ncbi:hypothetical protein TRFO_08929 [Tritrichomonas foetus]|uniref:General transcription factor TFIIB n=1 Tax=Tritrichomonas foetus TaxID=1144522 RepID=A0A1J4JGS2_9EUKA|nr:hypothetical protein TRFO_08929 [Tritrichomonas foetus]|eukprot:OHS98346.1 hypothetical protein TRFO_08929 [Tritrichomonas foetus]